MKHKELIAELAERMQWTPEEVQDVLSAFSSEVGSRLVDNDIVYPQYLTV